ncbi:hypothetical protein Hdeb2414_s0016g00487761 [Helianthus debilis subsp. tardiflorus]
MISRPPQLVAAHDDGGRWLPRTEQRRGEPEEPAVFSSESPPPPLSSDSSDRRWRWVTTGCPLAPQP